MINLKNISVYSTPETRERLQEQIQASCIAEGRAARRFGRPKSACPPFKDPDMAVNWCMGWRWEDEDIARRRSGPGVGATS